MKTIHHVLDVDSAPSKIWWALTQPSGMAAWWSTKVDTPRAAVGGEVHWTFAGDFNPVMEITRLEPEHELDWRCLTDMTRGRTVRSASRSTPLTTGAPVCAS